MGQWDHPARELVDGRHRRTIRAARIRAEPLENQDN
jgi:hypothetical protein